MLDIGGERGSLVLQWAESAKKSDPGKTPKVIQVIFRGDVIEVYPRITYQTDQKEFFQQMVDSHGIQECRVKMK
jgi:hypothetical protein